MINFVNDYSTGCAPEILKALEKHNTTPYSGYGTDALCAEAKELLSYEIERDDIDIHFMEGGTQTNLTVIAAVLRSHEAVIATDYSHIAAHETGAIEATGHKVLTVPHENGKLTVDSIDACFLQHSDEHMVKPKMIYLSQTTELGTLYLKEELKAISDYAKSRGLWVYIDGARMASALTAATADCTLKDIGAFSDVFTIGGTKNGMLCGEAVVITADPLKEDFRYLIKQRGGLMAKGWLLGLQYIEMFRDGLYYRYGEHSNAQAEKITQCLKENGFPLFVDSPTNQIFVVFTMEEILKLSENIGFEINEKIGADKGVVRFVTSYATTDREVEILCSLLDRLAIDAMRQ